MSNVVKIQPIVDISKNEINSLEKVTGVHPDVFTNQKGKAVEEYLLRFQENGYCFFLNENNGIFSCDVYQARPAICKKYPLKHYRKTSVIQIERNFLIIF